MKTLLASAILAASLAGVVPAAAQRIDVGPVGPSVDLRSRAQRDRDVRRDDLRRDDYRRDRFSDDRMYRRQRYDDDRPGNRRGYDC